MRVLVTGAGGFLGRHVVARLLQRGHGVRALIRPASVAPSWSGQVEVVRADLRVERELVLLLQDVDVVVHLAAGVGGDEDVLFASTVIATERLLEAMACSAVKRLVLASSLVVYDWSRARGVLDEDTPLARDIYRRGGYDIAKLWQERIVMRAAETRQWDLTILRPGFIWGQTREEIAGMGRVAGRVNLLIGPATRLPLTHVENCADCFVVATESAAAAGQTFNVVDGDDIRVWRYARAYARGTGRGGIPVPVPYRVAYAVALLAKATSRVLFGEKGKLPSLLTPARFEAQFKPLRFPNRKLRERLGWSPPLSSEECLARTYVTPPDRRSGAGGASVPSGAPFGPGTPRTTAPS